MPQTVTRRVARKISGTAFAPVQENKCLCRRSVDPASDPNACLLGDPFQIGEASRAAPGSFQAASASPKVGPSICTAATERSAPNSILKES